MNARKSLMTADGFAQRCQVSMIRESRLRTEAIEADTIDDRAVREIGCRGVEMTTRARARAPGCAMGIGDRSMRSRMVEPAACPS